MPHKFRHRQAVPPLPLGSPRAALRPFFPGAAPGPAVVKLAADKSDDPEYKFVTREIARMRTRLFSLPPRFPARPIPTPLLPSAPPPPTRRRLCLRRTFTAVSARIFSHRVNNYRAHKT